MTTVVFVRTPVPMFAASLIGLLFAWLAIAGACKPAIAQEPYEVIQINKQFVIPTIQGTESREEKAKLRTEITNARKLMSDMGDKIQSALAGGNDPSSVPGYDTYLKEFRLASMTQTDDQTLSQLGAMREDFLKDFLSDNSVGPGRQSMIDQSIIPELEKIIEGKFHPAVRLNAILLLGMLNNVEGKTRVALPQPSLKSLEYLIEVFVDAGNKYPLYLRVGAVAGIQRHVEINRHQASSRIGAAELNTITSLALAIIGGTAPGQDQWPGELAYWLRRRSIQTLGAIGNAGPAGEILDSIAAVLKDEKQSFWMRFDALAAINKLDLKSVDKAKISGLPLAITEFTSKTLDQQSKSLLNTLDELIYANILFEDKDLLKSGSAKTGGEKRNEGPSSGMSGLEGGGEQSTSGGGEAAKVEKPKVELPVYQLNNTRRVVKSTVVTAKDALSRQQGKEGLVVIASPEEVKFIQKAVEVLDRVLADSDLGIVNLETVDDEDKEDANADDKEVEQSITQQIAEVLSNGSRDLNELIRDQKGDAAGDPLFDSNQQDGATQGAQPSDTAGDKVGG